MEEEKIKANRLIEEELEKASGGYSEAEYYAENEKFGLIDTEAHLLSRTACQDCDRGKLRFIRYQPGLFGNREAVYCCDLCAEYTAAALRN